MLKKPITILIALVNLVIFCRAQLNIQIVDPSSFTNDIEETKNENRDISLDDLCLNIECELGEKCVINDNEATCECYDDCEIPMDDRQKICTTSNQTFQSDCHFLRQKCFCNKNYHKCVDTSILNDKLDYYGECRHIEYCSDKEREIFIERMKIWLDEVLHILNDRKDLNPKYKNLVKLADEMKINHAEKYWIYGVTYEFCDLDKSNDHSIQKEELSVLISSIKSLEHCIQPFLDECDKNQNDMISDIEWGSCLGLAPNEMDLLRKYC